MTCPSPFTADELNYLIALTGGGESNNIRPGGTFTGQCLLSLRSKLESMLAAGTQK